jgi:hypothetical protein
VTLDASRRERDEAKKRNEKREVRGDEIKMEISNKFQQLHNYTQEENRKTAISHTC